MEKRNTKMGYLEKFKKPNIITLSYDKVMNAARSRSIWYLTFGIACCAIEMMATGASHYDLDRFGMPAGSPGNMLRSYRGSMSRWLSQTG